MEPTTNESPQTPVHRLANFLVLVLRLVPLVLWRLLALLVFTLLNLVFQNEVWPNTPNAAVFFCGVGLIILVLVAWLASALAWRVADTISGEPWNTTWRLVAVLGFSGATVLTAASTVVFFALLLK